MSHPTSFEQYERRVAYNTRITGRGADVQTHFPCPWCAHEGFMVVAVTDFEQVEMQKEHTCSDCGRSGRTLIDRTDGGMTAEIVQTGGPDAPEWLDPAPRRVED